MRTARKVASVVVLGDLVWFASLRLASSLLTPAAWVLTPPRGHWSYPAHPGVMGIVPRGRSWWVVASTSPRILHAQK